MRILYNILAVVYSIKTVSYAIYCIKNKEKGILFLFLLSALLLISPIMMLIN